MRHPQHDYSSGAGYFVTFVTVHRMPVLGEVIDGEFVTSAAGRIVETVAHGLPTRFAGLGLDAIQIMPDHVHAIFIITSPTGQIGYSLADVINVLKGTSSRSINQSLERQGNSIWQRGYYDRVIRSERELEKFRNYLQTNPLRKKLGI
jgi:putative transposase